MSERARQLLIALAVGAVTVIITLILIVLLDASQSPAPRVACPDSVEDTQKIRRMMERGFDSAFQQQIGQLYKIYGQNAPSVEKQRQYTKTGIENAIAAYRIGISAVEAWEC